MRARYLTVGRRRVHLRHDGRGPPLVMLHPSPLSSAAVAPLAGELARSFNVVALDTPGYGLSDPLVPRPKSLADFLEPLAETLDALGIDQCCLYGAATGAQIALEFAKRHPDRVALLVMDSAGHIDPDDCDRYVARYFPDVTPRDDGGHLSTWWQMVRDLNVFFPWCETRAANRVQRDLPAPHALQAILLDYLRAGTHYADAYRPAFHNERAERVAGLEVPTLLTRWQSSIVLGLTDALIAAGLPACVEVLDLAEGFAARARGLHDAIAARYDAPAYRLPAEPLPTEQIAGAYVDAGSTSLHLLGRVAGPERPVVLLHAAGAGERTLRAIAARVSATHPVVAIDLPGHGQSGLPDPPPASVRDHAMVIQAAIERLGFDGVHVIGQEFGAQVALELANLTPPLVRTVVAIDLPCIDPAERDGLRLGYVPELTPRSDGAHLIAAWQMLRDRELYWPWYAHTREAIIDADPDLDCERQQQRLLALLECGSNFGPAARLMLDYDSTAAVVRLRCPIVLATRPSHPLRHRVAQLHASVPQTRLLPLPADPASWWLSIGETLAALEIIRRGKH